MPFIKDEVVRLKSKPHQQGRFVEDDPKNANTARVLWDGEERWHLASYACIEPVPRPSAWERLDNSEPDQPLPKAPETGPDWVGLWVRTPGQIAKRDYSAEAQQERYRHMNEEGQVVGYSDSHGLCLEVRFAYAGKTAWFDPDELLLV